jgi:hypothetical protein
MSHLSRSWRSHKAKIDPQNAHENPAMQPLRAAGKCGEANWPLPVHNEGKGAVTSFPVRRENKVILLRAQKMIPRVKETKGFLEVRSEHLKKKIIVIIMIIIIMNGNNELMSKEKRRDTANTFAK